MSDLGNNSSFVAPLWWLRAFESALQMRSLNVSPQDMALGSGLSPALTDAEMNALLVLLQSAQAQILSGHKWLHFGSENLDKNNAYFTRTKSFLFLRVAQLLRAIQINSSVGSESIDPVSLFEREERRRDQQGSWKAMYKLAPMSAELILGYGEPFSELIRLLDGKPRVHRILGRYSPMVLRPSVWLELSQLEQYLFLQIQKASSWDKSPLRWDSVFGKGFESLFWGLDLQVSKKLSAEQSLFGRKLKLLKRAGRKLADQGLIKVPNELDYLAIDHEGDPLAVVWQLNDQISRDKELQRYEESCSRHFREHLLESAIKKLIPVLGESAKNAQEAHLGLWREIEEIDRTNSFGYVKLEGNLLLSISSLFFEWSLRSKVEGHPLQLPGLLKDCPAVQVIHDKKSLGERLQIFSNLILNQLDYQRDLENVARATISSPVSLRQHEVLEYLATHTMKSIGKEAVQTDSEKISVTSSTRSLTKTTAIPHGLPTARGASDSELRKKATDELSRLREKDPKRYQSLKQNYLDTLELERKQIILEMKERMQPSAFDDHLRYSLVKYMIENPSCWSAEDSHLPRFI